MVGLLSKQGLCPAETNSRRGSRGAKGALPPPPSPQKIALPNSQARIQGGPRGPWPPPLQNPGSAYELSRVRAQDGVPDVRKGTLDIKKLRGPRYSEVCPRYLPRSRIGAPPPPGVNIQNYRPSSDPSFPTLLALLLLFILFLEIPTFSYIFGIHLNFFYM